MRHRLVRFIYSSDRQMSGMLRCASVYCYNVNNGRARAYWMCRFFVLFVSVVALSRFLSLCLCFGFFRFLCICWSLLCTFHGFFWILLQSKAATTYAFIRGITREFAIDVSYNILWILVVFTQISPIMEIRRKMREKGLRSTDTSFNHFHDKR